MAFKIVGVTDLNPALVAGARPASGRSACPACGLSGEAARRLTGNTDIDVFCAQPQQGVPQHGALQGSQLLEEIRPLDIDEANTVCVHHRDEIEDGTIAHGAQLIGDMARALFWSLLPRPVSHAVDRLFQASKEIAGAGK